MCKLTGTIWVLKDHVIEITILHRGYLITSQWQIPVLDTENGISTNHLQVEQRILQLVAWLLVQRLADQEGELVGVLAGGGHPHRARPVVVEVGQLVRQLLDMLRLQTGVILDDATKRNVKAKFQRIENWWSFLLVASRVDCPLPHRLRHQKEVVSLG